MTHSLDLLLDYQMAAGHYPGGVVHVERAGHVLAHRVCGKLRPGESDAMRDDALFRIASLTKPVVSVLALMEVEAGRLDLDLPVANYLPELARVRLANAAAPKRAPTVRDLMRHTSGFAYAGEVSDAAIREQLARSPTFARVPAVAADEFLTSLGSIPLCAEPGTRFSYGTSTDVLGLVVEAIEGRPLGQVLEERVLRPLGMNDTTFVVPEGAYARLASAYAEDVAWHRMVPQYGVRGATPAWMDCGGAGLVSTVADYACFARMLSQRGATPAGRLLSEKTFALIAENQLPPGVDGPSGYVGAGFGFGLGLAVRLSWGAGAMPCAPGELTWSGISGTAMFVDPSEQWFAVSFTCNMSSRQVARFELRRALARL
jgi:CubicO group peptidase (beta-lactamase class C family)